MVTQTRPTYDWAKVLNFTATGNALPYLVSGWGAPEEGLVWTDGLNAKLSFTAKPPTADVSMVFSCFPYLGDGKIPFQELHVFVNFLRVGFVAVKGPSEIEIEIPRHVFTHPNVDIDLYLPRATSPVTLGTGLDQRDLGIAVNRLMLMLS